jgi:hypothetical protein
MADDEPAGKVDGAKLFAALKAAPNRAQFWDGLTAEQKAAWNAEWTREQKEIEREYEDLGKSKPHPAPSPPP